MHQSFLTFNLYISRNRSQKKIIIITTQTRQSIFLSTLHPDGASSKPSSNYKIITIKQTNQPPQKKNEKQNIYPSYKTKSHTITINPKQNKSTTKHSTFQMKLTKTLSTWISFDMPLFTPVRTTLVGFTAWNLFFLIAIIIHIHYGHKQLTPPTKHSPNHLPQFYTQTTIPTTQ